jgi:hypothetical protein
MRISLISLLGFLCVAAVCGTGGDRESPDDIPVAAHLDDFGFVELAKGSRDAGAANVAPFRIYGGDGDMLELRHRVTNHLNQAGWEVSVSSEPAEVFYADDKSGTQCLSFLDLNGTGYRSNEARRRAAVRRVLPIETLSEHDLVVMIVKFGCA